MRVFSWVGCLVLLVVGLSGCQQTQVARGQEPAPRRASQELTMAQNGGSVTLKVRVDEDGTNPLSNNVNETYAGGAGDLPAAVLQA